MSNVAFTEILARRKRYFATDPRNFEFEGLLASGGHGDTYLISELNSDRTLTRKFVAKFSTADIRSLTDLQKEIRIAQRLYGTIHIAQPILDNERMLTLPRNPLNAPAEDKIVLFLEYLPGVTLGEFIRRAQQWDVIPNRVLWMIFRCCMTIFPERLVSSSFVNMSSFSS